ncbi:MAG: alpha/beta hydrolase [Candidatus Sungiibacteriota bacterium]
MKKVFIIHGFEGSPNGGWRPWLMTELKKQEIYACALSMPTPENPVCEEWVGEISRQVERSIGDEIYLVGHSLGVPAILRYLESAQAKFISGAVLVSGPSEKTHNRKIDSFLDKNFDFEKIKSKCKAFSIIHGDNDPYVPLDNAKFLSQKLSGELIIVENGGHLNGSAGWFNLPQCLEQLKKMMK